MAAIRRGGVRVGRFMHVCKTVRQWHALADVIHHTIIILEVGQEGGYVGAEPLEVGLALQRVQPRELLTGDLQERSLLGTPGARKRQVVSVRKPLHL